jgi:hypothetical protein
MALVILLGIVRVAVSAANAITSGCFAVVAEVSSTVVALVNPHPRTGKSIGIVTAIWTSCHRFASLGLKNK